MENNISNVVNFNQSESIDKGHIRCLMAVPANLESLIKELEEA